MKRFLFVIITLSIIILPATAQRTVDENTVKALLARSDSFMKHIYDGSYQEAFDVVRSTPSAISGEKLDALQKATATQLESIVGVYGRELEAQYIGFNSLSDFLLRVIYVVRYEKHIIWWQIIFYRGAEDEWLFSTISFDDDMEKLMGLTF